MLNFLKTEKRSSILTCEKYRPKQIKKCDASHYAARIETILTLKAIELEDDGVMTYEKVEIIRRNDGSIRFNNKMPYHVTLGYIGTNGVTMLPQTQSLMVTPFSYANTQFKNVPSTFQVGYINDFGGLSFYEINCPVVNNICNISVANRDQ